MVLLQWISYYATEPIIINEIILAGTSKIGQGCYRWYAFSKFCAVEHMSIMSMKRNSRAFKFENSSILAHVSSGKVSIRFLGRIEACINLTIILKASNEALFLALDRLLFLSREDSQGFNVVKVMISSLIIRGLAAAISLYPLERQ